MDEIDGFWVGWIPGILSQIFSQFGCSGAHDSIDQIMPIELNSRFSYRVVFLTANCVRVEIYSRQGDNLGHFP